MDIITKDNTKETVPRIWFGTGKRNEKNQPIGFWEYNVTTDFLKRKKTAQIIDILY